MSFAARPDRRRLRSRAAAAGPLSSGAADRSALPRRRSAARRGLQLGLVPAEQDAREGRHVQRLPQAAQRKAARWRATPLCSTCHLAEQVRHRRAPPSHAGQRRRGMRRLSHADHHLHGRGSASRSQPARAAARSVGHVRYAERVQRLPHEAGCALGGGAREGVVRPRPAGLPALRAPRSRPPCGRTRTARRNCAPSPAIPREPPIARATALAQIDASANGAALETRRTKPARSERARQAWRAAVAGQCPLDRARAAGRAAALRSAEGHPHRSGESSRIGSCRSADAPNAAPLSSARPAEYVETQRFNADRAEARVNLGTFYGSRGDAIERRGRAEGGHSPGTVLHSRVRESRGSVPSASAATRTVNAFCAQGLAVAPTSGVLHYALGLALVRLKQTRRGTRRARSARTRSNRRTRALLMPTASRCTRRARSDAAKATLERALARILTTRTVRAALASFTKDEQR